jgi:transcriptional regulator with XRE-family HTH domain
MLIGDHIRAIREAKNLTQGDIEKRCGLLRAYISRVEDVHTLPSSETLEKRAELPGGFSLGMGPDNAA